MSDQEKLRPTTEDIDMSFDVKIGPQKNHSLHETIMSYASDQARNQRPDWFDPETGSFSEAGRDKVREIYGFWEGFDKVLSRVDRELRDKKQ